MKKIEERDGIKLYELEDFIERIIFIGNSLVIMYDQNIYNTKPPKKFFSIYTNVVTAIIALNVDTHNRIRKNFLKENGYDSFYDLYINSTDGKDFPKNTTEDKQERYNQFIFDYNSNKINRFHLEHPGDFERQLRKEYEKFNTDVGILYRNQKIDIKNFNSIYEKKINIKNLPSIVVSMLNEKKNNLLRIEKDYNVIDLIQNLYDNCIIDFANNETKLYFELNK